ncbi:serine protease inhibitor swm-1-like [Hylaeus anthracinus]|uniref:serine protease inhibitor swm-1-like n=1 Tax=Hylaeus anthracinus TaxID=313031 RepID=UPI0023B8A9BC|nr:serine protease inhibitor swm-1-like [Hylaeus anthracinus]
MSKYIVALMVLSAVVFTATQAKESCQHKETWSLCGTMCEPSCKDPNPNPMFCPGIACTMLTSSCRCEKGLVRNHKTSKCVELKDC